MADTRTITIPGVIIKPMKKFSDERGWLSECFRRDELDSGLAPAMAYISATLPGKARGPHEHLEQTDCFCFIGPSTFRLYLWDNRTGSPGYGKSESTLVEKKNNVMVIIPPGVVHAYKNIGTEEGLVLNFPNRLYAGHGKKEKVDEVRYENDPNSTYRID